MLADEDVIWIPATSVELLATTLEMILFLKYHRKMLTLSLVTSALIDITV